MKSFLLFFCGLSLSAFCFGDDRIQKRAVLILPDQIECIIGSGHYLSGEIGFRWDGPESLKINTWYGPGLRNRAGAPNQLIVGIKVVDDEGKELERSFFVSMPPIPDGELVIKSGEYNRFRFFLWNGSVVFPRPGNYCAEVTFSEAWTGKTNVNFTSNKRWFKVIEAPSKKGSL